MLYRKINCKDRLPEKERAEYSTDIGTLFFSEKEWWDEFQEFPEWWLEEVTLPTDDEIEKMAFGKYGTADYVFHRRNGYITGFKSALKYMEGK